MSTHGETLDAMFFRRRVTRSWSATEICLATLYALHIGGGYY